MDVPFELALTATYSIANDDMTERMANLFKRAGIDINILGVGEGQDRRNYVQFGSVINIGNDRTKNAKELAKAILISSMGLNFYHDIPMAALAIYIGTLREKSGEKSIDQVCRCEAEQCRFNYTLTPASGEPTSGVFHLSQDNTSHHAGKIGEWDWSCHYMNNKIRAQGNRSTLNHENGPYVFQGCSIAEKHGNTLECCKY